MDLPPLPRRLAAEALGTAGFLFFAFSGIAVATELDGIMGWGGVAAGFGVGLGMMIAAFGHISGGHLNPAVTAGLAIGGRFPAKDVVPYWLAQLGGALAAALLAWAVYPGDVRSSLVNAPGPGVSGGAALVLEIITTFLFVAVILTVATDDRAPWKGIQAPVMIGGFIFIAGWVVGPFSGFSFNPARSLAPAIIDGDFTDIWIYLVGPLVGGVLAGIVHPFIVGGRTAEV